MGTTKMTVLWVLALLALPCFVKGNYPVGITNCNVSVWYDRAPSRAVTMNQGTTEVMLALKLASRMVATAWLDDEIWPELEEEYSKILAFERYPNASALFALDPDFLYASYSSAFEISRVNYTNFLDAEECSLVIPRVNKSDRVYCRQELHDGEIKTYLQTPFCELSELRPEQLTVQELFDEIWDIATIFNVFDNARSLIDSIEEHFENAQRVSQGTSGEDALSVFWLDGWDADEPYVGACCGGPQIILEHAGARNVFDDLGVEERRSWENVQWENVSAVDPDLIVLVNASWDTAEEKLFNLCNSTKTRNLRAVQNRAFLVVPFSASTLGVRMGALAYNLAEAMVALARGRPLPALEFTDVSIAGGGSEAITRSGVKVYTKFPMWNGTDLDTFCPGSPPDLEIRDVSPMGAEESGSDDLPDWSVALIVIFGIVTVILVGFLVFVVAREKKGTPLFEPMIKPESSVA